jgi:hypothetical protein
MNKCKRGLFDERNKWGGEGKVECDVEVNIIKAHYIHVWKYHNENPLWN